MLLNGKHKFTKSTLNFHRFYSNTTGPPKKRPGGDGEDGKSGRFMRLLYPGMMWSVSPALMNNGACCFL
jgi:hypothetical protein